jgi:hypothetical protein
MTPLRPQTKEDTIHVRAFSQEVSPAPYVCFLVRAPLKATNRKHPAICLMLLSLSQNALKTDHLQRMFRSKK